MCVTHLENKRIFADCTNKSSPTRAAPNRRVIEFDDAKSLCYSCSMLRCFINTPIESSESASGVMTVKVMSWMLSASSVIVPRTARLW